MPIIVKDAYYCQLLLRHFFLKIKKTIQCNSVGMYYKPYVNRIALIMSDVTPYDFKKKKLAIIGIFNFLIQLLYILIAHRY